jgi:ABC-2 type transport system ATP-binding protein
MNAIELDHVVKRFGAVTAVDQVSLSVPQGSLYGFIGPNGSGKTTTLRMILHIYMPDEGRVVVLGSEDTRQARDRVGYLPEERGLYKKITVRRILEYYGELKGMKPGELRAEIASWLDRMQLAEAANRKIEALSKGMSQKVQFISAVIHRPELIILDEPFSGLDPVNAEVLREAILDLKRQGATIVFSTHDMSTAERLCDRIFMIYKGRKVLDGTLREIQDAHGQDTIRVRLDAPHSAWSGLPGVRELVDHGNLQELRYDGDPNDLLARLVNLAPVRHFEIARPSLHEIFVRIAAPDRADLNLALENTGRE